MIDKAAATLLERALAAGAEQAEVCATRHESIAVQFEKNDLKLAHIDEGNALGLRVLLDHKIGFSATNQTDERSLEATARAALELARLSVPDEHNVLAAPRPLAPPLELALADVDALDIDAAVGRGQDFMRKVLNVDARIMVDKADLTVSRGERVVLTASGIDARERDAAVGVGVFGMARDGDDVGGFDYWGDRVRKLGALDAAIAETVERFTSTVLGNLDARAAESYRGPVLFAPQAFAEVFIDPLVAAANAIAVQRGRSALAQKIGAVIGAPSLTIVDDPFDTTLGGATTFDREGQPAEQFTLVDAGMLRGYFYNTYAAHRDGRQSTGHASGGPRALPGIGPHAIVVAAGDGGDTGALFRTLDRGLYVQRFSGTVDSASGDFSGVAKSARWIENGVPVRSLKETLISGNAFELLKGALVLGSVSERIMGYMRSPAAIVDGINVTAG
jgi:PmbA protein